MAVVEFTNGRRRFCSAAQGRRIWQVLNGEIEPSKQEATYCSYVRRVYLSRMNAPHSYQERYSYLFPDNSVVHRPRVDVFIETRKDLV